MFQSVSATSASSLIRRGIQTHEVAISQFGKRSASEAFRTEVNSRWRFPRGAGHTAIGDQRDLISLILQDTERGDEFVQFWHATGTRTLEADDHNDIPVQGRQR